MGFSRLFWKLKEGGYINIIMNILITGGCGFIGQHLVEYLLNNISYKITVIDYNLDSKFLDDLSYHQNKDNITFINEDIRIDILYKLNIKFDVIIHLAASTNVRESFNNVKEVNDNNINGSYSILDYAITSNVKQFIFASSSSVYGENTNYPWNENDTNLKPISPYALTKLMGEQIGYMYSQLYGIRFIALRFFNVFGPKLRESLLMSKICEAIKNNTEFELFGDGTQSRDFTYIDNVISAIISSMNYTQSIYECFNIGSGQNIYVNDVITVMKMLTHKDIKIKYLPKALGDVYCSLADINKARELLKYDVKISFKDGLKKFVEWKKGVL